MNTQVVPMIGERSNLVSRGVERLRGAALAAVAALLGITFLLLLVADQARVVAGAR